GAFREIAYAVEQVLYHQCRKILKRDAALVGMELAAGLRFPFLIKWSRSRDNDYMIRVGLEREREIESLCKVPATNDPRCVGRRVSVLECLFANTGENDRRAARKLLTVCDHKVERLRSERDYEIEAHRCIFLLQKI